MLTDLNSEPLFAGIPKILIEIWLFEHEFRTRDFDQLQSFGSIKFSNMLFKNFHISFAFLTKTRTEG